MASRIDKLRNVIGVDSVLNKIKDVDILLERILLEARKVMNADAGSIYEKKGEKLAVSYAQNDTQSADLKPGEKYIYDYFTVPIGTGTTSGYAAMTGEPVNVKNVYDIPDGAPYGFDPSYDKMSGYKTVSTLSIPLVTNMGELLGVLQLINKKDKLDRNIAFSKDDELIGMHFATNATVALERARMTRELLLRMTKMSEMRDPKETGAHVNRVAGYSLEIYQRWANMNGVPPKQIERTRDNLRMAAMLHDVGKVAISDVILKKPGKFTDEERVIMETHTWKGAWLFQNKQSDFDMLAQEIVVNHHENWDGTGYPGYIDIETGEPTKKDSKGNARRKKGEEIPIMGRIVAIADVYDALRSNRVYKKAWNEEDTLKTIRDLGNREKERIKFDPDLVDIFFAVYPSIKTVSARFAEVEENANGEDPDGDS
jgi:response regulator RpfG family c-di-GMP phosphodiesterase